MYLDDIKIQKIKSVIYQDSIHYVGEEACNINMKELLNNIISNLRESPELTDNEFDTLCDDIKVQYKKRKYHNGTFVGSKLSQVISQPITQNKLSSFHSAGVANDEDSNIKYKTILSNSQSKKDLVCNVYFKYINTTDDILYYKNKFVYKTFGDFVQNVTLFVDEYDYSTSRVDENTNMKFPVLYIKFDLDAIYESRITLFNFLNILSESYQNIRILDPTDSMCIEEVTSNAVIENAFNSNIKIFKSRFNVVRHSFKDENASCEIKKWSEVRNKFSVEHVLSVKILDPDVLILDNIHPSEIKKLREVIFIDKNEGRLLKSIDNKLLCIYSEITSPSIKNNVIYNILNDDIMNTSIHGMPEVKRVDVEYDNKIKKPFLKVSGICLKDVLKLPFVDIKYTYGTNIQDVYNSLGLEVSKYVFKNKILGLISSGNKNRQIVESIEMISNSITNTGRIVGIDRTGLEKSGNGFLTVLSFEDIMKGLTITSKGCVDNVNDVASSIIIGNKLSKKGMYHN
ncbi:DNA-directed RNA polymerase III subunit RPC1 [Lobulomyces angularis]|nr:DNA-directed RNA polymerase III subunit RPC1 [Lobulomyces angularis]